MALGTWVARPWQRRYLALIDLVQVFVDALLRVLRGGARGRDKILVFGVILVGAVLVAVITRWVMAVTTS